MPFATVFTMILAGTFAAGGCAAGGDVPDGVPDPDRAVPDAWTAEVAPHVNLWYHGLAYAFGAASDGRDPVLPLFRAGYLSEIIEAKRSLGVYPTTLDERAAEFGSIFAGNDAYDPIQFLPLYFDDADALFSGIQLWREVGGDPRLAGSGEAARIVAFLTSLFPDDDERRVMAEWAEVLRREREEFFARYHEMRSPRMTETAASVQREWDELAPDLERFLDYMQLEGGRMLLVPALAGEGRSVTAGNFPPVIAVTLPPSGAPGNAVVAFVHELTYPLVDDVIREYVAPVRIREIGRRTLTARASVRAGAMLLEQVSAGRVPEYRDFFLERGGFRESGDDGAPPRSGRAAFVRAFPLPEGLADGLAEAIRRARAGI